MNRELNRRRFLGLGAATAATAVVPARLHAASWRNVSPPERVLSFFNTHTGERLKTAYCCGGTYRPEALSEINHILRDFRANEIKPIDPKLLDLLHELGGTLETDQAVPHHLRLSLAGDQRTAARTRRIPYRRGEPQPAHGWKSHRHSNSRREARSTFVPPPVRSSLAASATTRHPTSSTSTPAASDSGRTERRKKEGEEGRSIRLFDSSSFVLRFLLSSDD